MNSGILKHTLPRGQAYRSKSKVHQPADLNQYSLIIKELIIRLTNMTKVNIEGISFCVF